MISAIRLSHAAVLVSSALLAACAAPTPPASRAALQLPLQTAWYEGRTVHYVTTDVSDAEVAAAKGANFVPRLKDLLPASAAADGRKRSLLERVYSFDNTTQPTVFPSVPKPVGPGSRDPGYSPLWRMVKVTWLPGRSPRELKSEEEVLAAQDKADVRLTVTDIILNCPVIGVAGDGYLRGSRLVSIPAP
ncbi:MAG: hypothetical protein H7Z19_13705 [Chitinophagaceae bacterium]|nr:hypothetical protein [Rubrivivax sp.]